MKNILFVTLLTTGLVLGASAQDKQQDKLKESDVPTAVQTNFKTAFPNAKDVEWKMKEGKYKVAFEVNGTDHIASFGTDGKMMSKGMKIRTSELPSAVASAVKSAYADREINNVYRVDKDGTVAYLVKLDGDPETKVLYSADGQVVKEKKDQ
ncbi:MAG TPA: PepSY-like domain-containing protein [Niastella sp.]